MQEITTAVRPIPQGGGMIDVQYRAYEFGHHGHNYHLETQTGDVFHLFGESVCLYLLAINRRKRFVGFYAYMTPESDPIESIILNNDKEIRDVMGKDWNKLDAGLIARQLQRRLVR